MRYMSSCCWVGAPDLGFPQVLWRGFFLFVLLKTECRLHPCWVSVLPPSHIPAGDRLNHELLLKGWRTEALGAGSRLRNGFSIGSGAFQGQMIFHMGLTTAATYLVFRWHFLFYISPILRVPLLHALSDARWGRPERVVLGSLIKPSLPKPKFWEVSHSVTLVSQITANI